MTPYADTNFFTRLYLGLPELETVIRLVRKVEREGAERLPVTSLHRLELCNAIQLHVFWGRSAGHVRVTPEHAGAAWARFRSGLEAHRPLRSVNIPQAHLERQVEDLSLRHTAKHGFRTYDLLHVASALLLGCDAFWSFDAKAARLAKMEGLALRS